jgi:hypothetical protein
MNTYLVTIKIQSGEYEKNSQSLIGADTPEEAGRYALEGECHSDEDNQEWEADGVSDLGGEFFYSVYSCQLVEPEDVPVLVKYMVRFGGGELL